MNPTNDGNEKSSAEQARARFEEPRSYGKEPTMQEAETEELDLGGDVADLTENLGDYEATLDTDGGDGDDELEARGGSAETPFPGEFDESATDLDELLDFAPLADLDVAHGGIDVTGVHTNSQAGRRNVFQRNVDALAFVIAVGASSSVVNSGRRFSADYIIIRHRDNAVARHIRRSNMAFNWGRSFWISQGNTWNSAHYDTPARWRLENGIYTFRATLQVQGSAAFASSADWVFRVR